MRLREGKQLGQENKQIHFAQAGLPSNHAVLTLQHGGVPDALLYHHGRGMNWIL